MAKCDNCEFKNNEEKCYAEENPKLCELKNTIEAFKTAIRAKTLEKKYPSSQQQIINASKSIVEIARNPTIVSNQKKEERLKICHSCEWFDESQNRCKNCGCYLSVKTQFEVSKCPLDPPKW